MTKPTAAPTFTDAPTTKPPATLPAHRLGTCPHCGGENLPLRHGKLQPHPVVRVGPHGHHATDEDCPGACQKPGVES